MNDRRSTVSILTTDSLTPQLILGLALMRDAKGGAAASVPDADAQALTALGYVKRRAGRSVLTAAGKQLTNDWPPLAMLAALHFAGGNGLASKKIACPKPQWHGGRRRELWWNGFLIKKFGVLAPSQELILAAFEEEGWPERIDDPLPPRIGSVPSERLGEGVRGLNGCRKHDYLRFKRDGTGKGVIWYVPDEVREQFQFC